MATMNFRLMGRSGLRVSELCIGCGTFGTNWGTLGSDLAESRRILETFAEAGGNYIDTSNRYQEGQSEQFVGECVASDRDHWVIATKFTLFDGGADNNNPNLCGNHRTNLLRSVEASLKRLKTDHIDLLWAHIWDNTTPIDEMLRGLDDVVKSGKVCYVGASNFPAWWLARANTMADHWGKTPFIATQVEWPSSSARSSPSSSRCARSSTSRSSAGARSRAAWSLANTTAASSRPASTASPTRSTPRRSTSGTTSRSATSR